ncbi:MAG TPA: hypothetical protein VG889_21195 [Rhizomicrobium sp.]|nr:hypothetical protein [Rhizomicrobium sp.]
MSDKPPPPKKGLEEPEAAYQDDEDWLGSAEFLAWEERNKDALIESLREAEAQIERGEWFTLEETMARVRATIKRVAKKP